MDEQQIAKMALAHLTRKTTGQPALMVAGEYYTPDDLRAVMHQWGDNTASYIQRFLDAVEAGKRSILLEADRPPEVKVNPLPAGAWWVISHNKGVVRCNQYVMLKTGMSLEDI